ncbi:Retrotransposable element [Phytophthora palmivora]|uniref:RNA-directed DNA polymerase n=1 Tax=Phytophthora palmivora TaxID=4796 RepID=A0A2P4YLD0_9STRA|nr:Retrotransposable element [Phytophthora palmivora]
MRDLKEIICQLLTRQDLAAFNEKWNRDPRFTMEAITHAVNSVGRRYCAFGTREALHNEIKSLRKTRNMSVEEYDAQLHHLLQLERWVQSEDGEPMTVGTKCRYFSAGMPRSWQAAVIPQRSQWESLRSLKARYLQCERIEQYTMNDRANGKGSTTKKRKQEDQKKKTGRRHDEDKRKRKLESDDGCSFCKSKGNVWNNHRREECFRDPSSPRYRPRAGNKAGISKSMARSGANRSSWNKQIDTAAMAAPEIIKEIKHDDPLHYWSAEADEHGAAMQSVAEGYRQMKLPPLLVEVTLKHPLNKQTYSALLDTGATSSLVSAEVVSWYRPRGPQTWYRNVNDELQSTRGAIPLSMVLPEFSDKRVCQQECKIVDKLVYPIVLGTDFLQQQGSAVGHADDARTVRILDITGRSISVATLVPKEHLSSEQKTRLLDLLQSVQIVFQKRIGTLELEPYRRPVKEGSKPSAQPPYSIPLIHRKAVLEEVKRLVNLGVLEPDKNPPWAAPAFVIPKKDGSARFLSDFRKLNKCLERQYYPLHKIQDLIRELPQPTFVSALDLVMGYYSRVLAEENRPFTAIVLPWGKFRYCCLPMGISTAPEEFHAVMQQLLGDLPYVRVYLDDALVLSHAFDEHLRFLVTAEGKRPIAKKVDAILSLSKPRNIRDLRRFIGMINYYNDMWKGRSETLAPLTALTSIKRTSQWTSVEQQAPLAFWSRKCTTAQEHYTMNKKELLSVLELLREFRTIPWGRTLRIFTDHKDSIQATFTNEQTLRWRLEIEEYGPELVYVRGHENVVADALSRLPVDEIQSSRTANTAAAQQIMPVEKEKPTLSPLSLVEIAEAQLRTGLLEGPTVARRAIGSIPVLVSKANGRVIVPPEMITKILNTYHEWLVHPGEKIMIESIKAALTWPGMTASIRRWVRNCKTCARSKDRKAKYGKIPAKRVEVRPCQK